MWSSRADFLAYDIRDLPSRLEQEILAGTVALKDLPDAWNARFEEYFGLKVPDDIAVVGVGDIALGDLLKVPLTTVSWSRKDQGLNAAELLLNGLDSEERDAPRRVIIPPRLVARESSGVSRA